MVAKQELHKQQQIDTKLMHSLAKRYSAASRVASWRNRTLERICSRGRGTTADHEALERLLRRKGAFNIRIERHIWRDLDGERRPHTLARAAVTDMWPMGTHYWLRDNAIIGARFLASPRAAERRIGRELILSGLTFISSQAQLRRFESIIRSNKKSYASKAEHWPYIFAAIANNLNCSGVEGWAHKQDAWQILVWHLLDAIEDKKISLHSLTKKHRQFLGLIVPFLAKVRFYRCENSGSWEEIPAVRTSVRAWEHRLIVRLSELSRLRDFAFLAQDFRRFRGFLGGFWRSASLSEAVVRLDRAACREMLRDLPGESPSYAKNDPRYRNSDAALVYLLELDYIRFLGERTGKSEAWIRSMTERLLSTVLKLQDARTAAIARYGNDSYQRSGFFRNVTVARLQELYGAPSGDASTHFTGRDRIVPKGRKAAWTHFVWQLASWSAKQFLKTGDAGVLRQHNRFFTQGLRLFTGAREVSLDLDSKGRVRVIRVPAFRMPECYISDRAATGSQLVFPSPHTPLNWATAEMLHAFNLRGQVLRCLAQRGKKNG